MNKYVKIGMSALVALGIILFIVSMKPSDSPNTITNEPTTTVQPSTQSITISIQDLWTREQVTISNNQTLLGLLQDLALTKPELSLETKEYQGLGTLITKLGTHANGEQNAYWQYYVNGEQPLVGADAYLPKTGDVIEWKFAASEM